MAGLAWRICGSVEETIPIAPEVRETVLPRNDDRYEAAYARYGELYPRLRES